MSASNHTSVQAHNKDGQHLSLQHTSTDSPILPAENLRQLQQIDESLVGWVIDQTEKEATHRRREEVRINWFILIEHLSGLVCGTFVAIFGLASGVYLVMKGHDAAGVGICGVGLASIVSVLVARQQSKKGTAPPQQAGPKRRSTPKKVQ